MEIPIFYGVIGENPKEWTNQVEKYLSKIGIEDDKRIFEIAKTHLLGNALQWFENEGMCIADWDKNEIKWLNLKFRIIDRYSKILNKIREMETTIFENINGKGFIRIDGEVKCKYCEKIENVTLQEINYFEEWNILMNMKKDVNTKI
ncbi:hypothetical protein RhiirA1_542894 [Rhizophagus irregularis]|uniref:Retrotransposon gag domain-containing protein n=1 Tax=Rhizophagus irregularis TaxID=588596 RepID=A0A2N0QTL1_9GLOM|nr:hypothetical protein RhiirA1_542894 [Rhizophagus irregularis]